MALAHDNGGLGYLRSWPLMLHMEGLGRGYGVSEHATTSIHIDDGQLDNGLDWTWTKMARAQR
jgi:hypothetical protein